MNRARPMAARLKSKLNNPNNNMSAFWACGTPMLMRFYQVPVLLTRQQKSLT